MDAIKAAKGALRKQIENKIGSLSTDEKSRQTEHVLRQVTLVNLFNTLHLIYMQFCSCSTCLFLKTAKEFRCFSAQLTKYQRRQF